MNISFLISNLSGNTVLRTLPFAEILSKNHKISIIGMENGPLLAKSTKKITIISHKRKNFFKNVSKLLSSSKKADIVCVVNPVADISIAGALLKLAGKKLVIDFSEDQRYNPGENILREKWLLFKQIISGSIIFFADSIVVGTNYLKKKYGGIILRTPVDLRNFKGLNENAIKNKFGKKNLIVYGGSIKRFKGNEDLIEAFGIVEKKIGESTLVMAGAILSKIFFQEIKKQAKRISTNIHFTGFIPLNKMPEYVVSADCLVSTYPNISLRESQIPTRLFTYMASGKIIVATDVGETRQILKNGECGIIVRPDDPKSIAKGILMALNDKKSSLKMAIAAKKEAQKFSFETMQKDVEKSFLVN